jgi:hypothetical protein
MMAIEVKKTTIQVLVNLTMASSMYEEVIDLGFGKHRILLFSLGWV